ncbi:toll/interleukin-1 receptor domain-containing protein [Streptomyces tauricus]
MSAPRVFISHSRHPDTTVNAQAAVFALEALLGEEGCEPVMMDMAPGQDWMEAITEELGRADGMILIISKDALRSPWVQNELAMAELRHRSSGFPLIPVKLPDVTFEAMEGSGLRSLRKFQMLEWPADPDIESVRRAIRPELQYMRAQLSAAEEAARQLTPGEMLRQAKKLADEAQQLVDVAVAAERGKGTSWETIGEVLDGVSKSAAQKRFGGKIAAMLGDPGHLHSEAFGRMRKRLEQGWANVARTMMDHDTITNLSAATTAVTGTGSRLSANSGPVVLGDPRIGPTGIYRWSGRCRDCGSTDPESHHPVCPAGLDQWDDQKAGDPSPQPHPPSLEDRVSTLERAVERLLQMTSMAAEEDFAISEEARTIARPLRAETSENPAQAGDEPVVYRRLNSEGVTRKSYTYAGLKIDLPRPDSPSGEVREVPRRNS